MIEGNSSEQHRLECEAREWLSQCKSRGKSWWINTQKPRLVKIRGEESVKQLCEVMNQVLRY